LHPTQKTAQSKYTESEKEKATLQEVFFGEDSGSRKLKMQELPEAAQSQTRNAFEFYRRKYAIQKCVSSINDTNGSVFLYAQRTKSFCWTNLSLQECCSCNAQFRYNLCLGAESTLPCECCDSRESPRTLAHQLHARGKGGGGELHVFRQSSLPSTTDNHPRGWPNSPCSSFSAQRPIRPRASACPLSSGDHPRSEGELRRAARAP